MEQFGLQYADKIDLLQCSLAVKEDKIGRIDEEQRHHDGGAGKITSNIMWFLTKSYRDLSC